MKQQYIKPECTDITAQLGTDILEQAIGGQTYNTVGKSDNVDWSAKKQEWSDDFDDQSAWPEEYDLWK